MPTTRRASGLAILLASAVFVSWAALFISRTSAVAWNGRRYFCLFDDAMISMRYADNLAHHRGLVWNVGERVEGYTNLLMTLLMTVPSALLEKRLAVLAVQVFGVLVALGFAWATLRLAEELGGPGSGLHPAATRVAGFVLGLGYYPLVYWSLMGMETGVLALLLLVCLVATLRILRAFGGRALVVLALAGGLAALTRADSVIVTAPLVLLALGCAWNERCVPRGALAVVLGLYVLLPAAQTAFRLAYYDSLVPVTYTLKLGGFPLAFRLRNGIGFLLPFVDQTWPLFLTATLGALSGPRGRRLLALALPVVLVAYQLGIGGDFSSYWRFLCPGMPILLVLALFGTRAVAGWAVSRLRLSPRRATPIGLALLFAVLVFVNRPFASEIAFRTAPFCAEDCGENVDIALAVRELTHSSATVGVLMAGTIPYYSERPAIDFLGKTDPHVASLPPDLSGAVAWHGMSSVPGHNKYDLEYSIVSRQPTYVESCRWGRQDVCRWVSERYQEVVFRGRLLYLLRDSPFVDWKKAKR